MAVTTRSADVNAPLFDRAAILDHLTELNTALAHQHAERVDLLVVGGSYLPLLGDPFANLFATAAGGGTALPRD